MADVRELVILRSVTLNAKPETPFMRRVADLKMTLRRFVVRSARIKFFHWVYSLSYKGHLCMAAQLGRRISGTRAVYLSSGLVAEELIVGVSDVDIAVFGDWAEKQQFFLMKILAVLTRMLPLFDRNSAINVATMTDLKTLSSTNMLIALVHARGRQQWRLLYGEPVLATLPEISSERFAGCVYMEIRRWWGTLSRMTFGSGIIARDPIFRNSISFKTAAETLRAERMLLRNDIDNTRRSALIEQELIHSEDSTLRILLKSAAEQYLEIEKDSREPILKWFLSRVERLHFEIRHKPSFALTARVKVTGTADGRIIAPQTMIHAQQLIELAEREWSGLRSVFLVPCVAMASPDQLGLMFEVKERYVPTIEQLQRLLSLHNTVNLPQRVNLYLLLSHAAYHLNTKGALEIFYSTLFPEANPDVFFALSQPQYVLYGHPRSLVAPLGWSAFAQELMLEELSIRKGSYTRFGLMSRPLQIENLRNFWRFLQLCVIERSRKEGEVILPTTISAIRVALVRWHPDSEFDLLSLEQLHQLALERVDQRATDINALMNCLYATFASKQTDSE